MHAEKVVEKTPAAPTGPAAIPLEALLNDKVSIDLGVLFNTGDADLLREEDIIINAFKLNSVPKLIAFTCERENIQKLIQYAIKFPQNPDNTEQTHK